MKMKNPENIKKVKKVKIFERNGIYCIYLQEKYRGTISQVDGSSTKITNSVNRL